MIFLRATSKRKTFFCLKKSLNRAAEKSDEGIMEKKDFYDLLKSVPKAEIHLHSEACTSRKTIKELYKKSRGKEMTDQEMESLFSYDDLVGFLKAFIEIQTFYSSKEDLKYIVSDLLSYLTENNIVYAETFVSVTSFMKKNISFHEIIDVFTQGILEAKEKYGITIRLIVDVSRSFGLDNAMHNLDLILEEKNPYIIGIGLGGDEAAGPAKEYAAVFEKAHKAGLHTVLHAGEVVDSWSMKDAINLCHAERIGHGISAAYDDAFMEELKEKQLPLEVCPTSNLFTKKYVIDFKDHPLKKLYQKGLLVTVNTDDPTFFKVTLIEELYKVYSELDFSLCDIKKIITNAFKASFISDAEKTNYINLFNEKWDEWFKGHSDIEEK